MKWFAVIESALWKYKLISTSCLHVRAFLGLLDVLKYRQREPPPSSRPLSLAFSILLPVLLLTRCFYSRLSRYDSKTILNTQHSILTHTHNEILPCPPRNPIPPIPCLRRNWSLDYRLALSIPISKAVCPRLLRVQLRQQHPLGTGMCLSRPRQLHLPTRPHRECL